MDMVEYAPGMRTIIRDEEWLVKRVDAVKGLDTTALTCFGLSPLVKNREVVFLTDLEEIQIVNPLDTLFVSDESNRYTRTRLFLESLWRKRIPTDNNLHIGHRAAMDSLDYQLRPAKLALQHLRQRILIADSVGLGKTLEAGVLISELIARGKGRRILVVAIKSMMQQLQKEMWNRFTIPLVSLDSGKIQRIASQLPSNYNPLCYYDKAIISIDTLKYNSKYINYLERAYWDIIVIDEAHNVAKRGKSQAKRSKLAELLAKRSDNMIMLSATPHDGRAESFASLMNMLDPTAIADPSDYTKEDIEGLYIRRFKNDIGDSIAAFPERFVHQEECTSSKEEEEAYKILTNLNLNVDQRKSRVGDMLVQTVLTKSLFSSPDACSATIKERVKRLQELQKKHNDNSAYCSAIESDIEGLNSLKKAVDKIKSQHFSRYRKLLEMLKSSEYGWDSKNPQDRIVIFTERVATMEFLAKGLQSDLKLGKNAVLTLSGELSDTDQQDRVKAFGTLSSNVRILVATDVASEGLNLHYFCHRLIHFDIPWSLMIFQQRNGRIDRYGQEERPDICYLTIKSQNERIKGDMRVLDILMRKEEQAYKNIGDPTQLMKCTSVKEEEAKTGACMEKQNGQEFEALNEDDDEEESLEDLFSLFTEEVDDALGTNQGNIDRVETVTDRTLFADVDYLKLALNYFGTTLCKEQWGLFEDFGSGTGIDLKLERLTDYAKDRLSEVIPDELMPEGKTLRLSDNKKFCMGEMKQSLQIGSLGTAWPQTQYLWPLHPVITWMNDSCSLLFGRSQAPLAALNSLKPNEIIFVISGTLPNRQSDPVVDEFFGLYYTDGIFKRELSMNEVIRLTSLTEEPSNCGSLAQDKLKEALELRADAVNRAKAYLENLRQAYQQATDKLLDRELDKLADLEQKQEDYNKKHNENDKRKTSSVVNSEAKKVKELFEEFTARAENTLTAQNAPYIRIVAAFIGL
ncbi:MAG: SNF2-related protein [Candidatus Bruticola sp.]